MNLRKAEQKDKKDVLEIANLLYLDMPGFVWNTDEFVEKQIERGEYFLAEEEGKTMGVMSLRQRNGRLHIETLAVNDGHQTEGIGTALVEFAKKFAKENGFKILRAYSFYEYKKVDFYLSQGFSLLEKRGEYNGHKYYRFETAV